MPSLPPETGCSHKFIHKETSRRLEVDGRAFTRCVTFITVDVYFCEKCLHESSIKKQWNGQETDCDRPDWSKIGDFKKVYV